MQCSLANLHVREENVKTLACVLDCKLLDHFLRQTDVNWTPIQQRLQQSIVPFR